MACDFLPAQLHGRNSIGIQICGWLTGAEMFPLCMRGQATSLFAATLWGADLLVTITALTLVQLVTLGGAMWVYAAVNVLTVLFVFALCRAFRCVAGGY